MIISVAVIIIFDIIRKDVRLPVQLQRAMAAEAEAAREARAKVIILIIMIIMIIIIIMIVITMIMIIMIDMKMLQGRPGGQNDNSDDHTSCDMVQCTIGACCPCLCLHIKTLAGDSG